MRTNFIPRLIHRITRKSQPTNDCFNFYGHHINLQSGTPDYVAATVYRTTDPYSGELADFNFDFWTKELSIDYAETDKLYNTINQAFRTIYGHIKLVE